MVLGCIRELRRLPRYHPYQLAFSTRPQLLVSRIFISFDFIIIDGFARPLGRTNSCMAEFWALRDGLLLVKEFGINNLIVELDALSMVLLMKNNTCNLLIEPLLTNCKNLLKEFPNTQVVHAYREANQCANALAKMGAGSLTSFVDF